MEKRQDSILLFKVKSGGEEADGRARDSVVALGRGWGVAQPQPMRAETPAAFRRFRCRQENWTFTLGTL